MNYKHYIWDIGGTLFDTLSTSVAAFQKTLHEFHLKACDEEIYARLKKNSTIHAIQYFAKDRAIAFEKRYHEIEAPMQENPFMFPDTVTVLQHILANGGKNYIISNRDLQVLDFLERSHIKQYFTAIITSNDHFARKPSSESIDFLVEKFAMNRELSLVIGDRSLDIDAGKNAGMDTVLFSPDGFIQSEKATYTVQQLVEILSL